MQSMNRRDVVASLRRYFYDFTLLQLRDVHGCFHAYLHIRRVDLQEEQWLF